MSCLIADIGGTNTRCALAIDGQPVAVRTFANAEFDGAHAVLDRYLAELEGYARPASALLAVAAPVTGNEFRMVNLDWVISLAELQTSLKLRDVRVLNDFEALAYSLPVLADDDKLQIGGGRRRDNSPLAVLGPGTGLGVAQLVPTDTGWLAVAGEGGHVSLPARNATEATLIGQAADRNGYCSAECLVSGPGLARLHALLHAEKSAPPDAITKTALAGEARAAQSLSVFFELLGTVAANVALTLGARGGVFIGGGIVPRLAELFARSGFRQRFESAGPNHDYLRDIPTYLITAEQPALAGLASLADR